MNDQPLKKPTVANTSEYSLTIILAGPIMFSVCAKKSSKRQEFSMKFGIIQTKNRFYLYIIVLSTSIYYMVFSRGEVPASRLLKYYKSFKMKYQESVVK